MFDGSELPMEENLATSKELLARMAPLGLILEVEIGLVGGEEDGIDNSGADRVPRTADHRSVTARGQACDDS